nr:MAG: DNA pilot protein [Microvirus sp.]
MFTAAGLTAAAIGAQAGTGLVTGLLNYKSQRDLLNWQKDLQGDIFSREDSSIQRRVADLKAAGLSPVLAAGQGASAGSVVSTSAPRLDIQTDVASHALGLMRMENDIATSIEQRKLIAKQVEQAGALARNASAEAGIKEHDLSIYRRTGLPSNASNLGKIVKDLGGISDTPIIKSSLEKMREKMLEVQKNIRLKEEAARQNRERIKKTLKDYKIIR